MDLEQDIRYLDEGIDDGTKHFEECLKRRIGIVARFFRKKTAEAIVPDKMIKVVTGKQSISVVGEYIVASTSIVCVWSNVLTTLSCYHSSTLCHLHTSAMCQLSSYAHITLFVP